MAYIIYSNSTSATGRALAEALGIRGGTRPPSVRHNVVIRWGSVERLPIAPARVCNSRDAVALAMNKLESLRVMGRSRVRVPRVWVKGEADVDFPVLARKINHSQGADIMLCLQQQDLRRAANRGRKYFVKYIPTDREYRVHVFNGEIVRVNQKLLQERDAWVPHIRNVDNGYIFAQPRTELRAQDRETAINAVHALGLDFGAVDLVIGDDGLPYVLEINTGPSLADAGMDIYVPLFQRVIARGR